MLRWLGVDPTEQDPSSWDVRPFRDAWWTAPAPRQRGDSAYLVRRGTVRPVLSNGHDTAAGVYQEMVADQG